MRLFSRLFLFGVRWWERIKSKFFSLAISGSFAKFGSKTVLAPPLRLSGENRIEIGNGVFMGPGCWLQALPDGDNHSVAISIGDRTSMSGGCVISGVRQIHIEDSVLFARNVYVSDHIHKYSDITTPVIAQGIDKVRPVRIKRGAWIGQNVVICPGVTIGMGAVIGANAVVTHDIPNFSLAVGVPARVIKNNTEISR